MLQRIAKVTILFIAAGVGLYLGDVVGSIPRDALPYEYWGPAEALRYFYYYHGIVVGAVTTSFVYVASRLLRFPEVAALLVASVGSLYHPIWQQHITGSDFFSESGIFEIGGFQVPYFLGLLVVFGIVQVSKIVALPFLRKGAR